MACVWLIRTEFEDLSCTECTGQGNEFELIPTVKTETRHPVEGYFGNEFPISNRCGVVAAWSCKTLKNTICCIFLEKRPLRENFQNSVPKVFIATLVDVLCSNFVKFGRKKIGEIVGCLPDRKKNFASLSSSCYCADRIQNLPGPASHNGLIVLQSVHCRQSYTECVDAIKTGRKVFPVFGGSLASSRIINCFKMQSRGIAQFREYHQQTVKSSNSLNSCSSSLKSTHSWLFTARVTTTVILLTGKQGIFQDYEHRGMSTIPWVSPPFPSSPLPFPSSPLEVGLLNPAGNLGERCKLLHLGLGWSHSQNCIWCILALKSEIWQQQSYWFSWESNNEISCRIWNVKNHSKTVIGSCCIAIQKN